MDTWMNMCSTGIHNAEQVVQTLHNHHDSGGDWLIGSGKALWSLAGTHGSGYWWSGV